MVVVVRTFVLHEGVCPATRTLALDSGGRTPGSKLPASPPLLPRPDGGGRRVNPGTVPVYRALKTTSRPAPVVALRQARQPCPRAAPVESPRELQRAAAVETRPSSPRQHPKNLLILHNRDVEHFVNGLQLDNLYGQLNRQTKGAVSAPRQE